MGNVDAFTGGARETLECLLSRIERFNPQVNAVVTLDADSARTQADAIDAAWVRRDLLPAFAGSFVTIKDSLQTAGMRTTCGAPQWVSFVPEHNAVAVQRLIDAGCVLIGKTNVPIYTTDLQSYNALFGTTCNPWDLSRSSGGSSGGAAAAVACGFTAFELGSDIGGSIRIPAHFCGVYGHKPTYGQVPFRGHIPPPPGEPTEPDLAVLGPLTRSAEDLGRVMKLLAPTLPAARHGSLTGFRVAYWFDDADFPLDRAVRDRLAASVERLAAAGVRIEQARPVPALRELFDNYLRLLWPLTTAHMTPRSMQRLVDNARSHAPDSWHAKLARYAIATRQERLAANETRNRLRTQCRDFFARYDVLLLPAGPVTAIVHDHSEDLMGRHITVNGKRRWYWEQMAWISLATAAYLPATVAPVGTAADGLPVGMQIVGPEFGDLSTIEFARRIEAVLGGFRAPPGYE